MSLIVVAVVILLPSCSLSPPPPLSDGVPPCRRFLSPACTGLADCRIPQTGAPRAVHCALGRDQDVPGRGDAGAERGGAAARAPSAGELGRPGRGRLG